MVKNNVKVIANGWGLLITLILMSLICSCETRLLVDNELIETDSAANTVTLNLDVNKDWTAKSSADYWCTISPKEGNKDVKSIKVSVKSNDTYSDRECTITIVSKDKSISIAVKQDQNDGLFLETNQIDLSGESQDVSISVTSNIDYKVYVLDEWIQHLGTKALLISTDSFHVDKNNSLKSRTGIVRFSHDNGLQREVKIIQKPIDTIIVSQDSVSLDCEGNTISLDVLASGNFTINVPQEFSWLHAAKNFGQNQQEYKVRISADNYILTNTTQFYKDREGRLYLEYGSFKKEIVVSQLYKDYIWISESDVSLYAGDTISLIAKAIFHQWINNDLIWKSSDETIAKVDNSGTIVGINRGQATITISNIDNSISASCKVIVKNWRDDIVMEQEYNNNFGYANTIPYGKIMRFRLSNSDDVDVFMFSPPAQSFYVKFTYEGDTGTPDGVDKLITYTLYNLDRSEFGVGNLNFKSEGSVYSQSRWLNTAKGYIRISVHDHAKNYPQMIPTGYFLLQFTTEE